MTWRVASSERSGIGRAPSPTPGPLGVPPPSPRNCAPPPDLDPVIRGGGGGGGGGGGVEEPPPSLPHFVLTLLSGGGWSGWTGPDLTLLGTVKSFSRKSYLKQEVIENEQSIKQVNCWKLSLNKGKFRLCGDKLRCDMTCFMPCLHEVQDNGIPSLSWPHIRHILADHFKRPWIHWIGSRWAGVLLHLVQCAEQDQLLSNLIERNKVSLLLPRNDEIDPDSSDSQSIQL